MNKEIIVLVVISIVLISLIFIYKKKHTENYSSSSCDTSTGIFNVINVVGSYPMGSGENKLWLVESGYPAPIFLFFKGDPPNWIGNLSLFSRVLLSTKKLNNDSIELILFKPYDSYTLMTSLGSPDKPAPCVSVNKKGNATLDISKINQCRFPNLGQSYAMAGQTKDKKGTIEFWFPISDSGMKNMPLKEGDSIFISPDSLNWGVDDN